MSAAVLVALRVKGLARPEALAAAGGPAAEADLAALEEAGLAEVRPLGVRLTPAGIQAADAVLAAERDAADAGALETAYAAFEAVNDRLKAAMHDWVSREDPASGVDADAVLDRLDRVHERSRPILAAVAAQVPRLARYAERLDAAWERSAAGDHRWVAAPLLDSFHTVWFELHEELIRLTGRTRAGEAALGRAL